MRKLISALVLAVAIAGLSQGASVATPVPVEAKTNSRSAGPPRAPVNAAQSDAQIERTIRAKFAKSKINVEHFTVSVQNGVAVIEGKTSVIQHKGVATRLAKTGGALAVQNHIVISEEARARAAAKLAQVRGGGNGTQLARATVLPPAPRK